MARGADDGYQSSLVMGLKSSADAGRLAEELAFADHRLRRLEHDPPGLYRAVADAAARLEERSWLAFLIAYLGPLEGEEPFAEIERVRTSWGSGELPCSTACSAGPGPPTIRPAATKTLDAYKAWAARVGLAGIGVHRRRRLAARASVRARVRAPVAARPAS